MSSYEKFLEVDRLNYGINSINTNYEKDAKALYNEFMKIQKEKG